MMARARATIEGLGGMRDARCGPMTRMNSAARGSWASRLPARVPLRDLANDENPTVRRIASARGLRARRCLRGRRDAEHAGVVCSGESAQRVAGLDSRRNAV